MAISVQALDHVNIITSDLDGTAKFYQEVFDLERRDAPSPLTPQNAQWMYDAEDRAIFHLNSEDCPRHFDRDVSGEMTGPIHHVALRCTGNAEMQARLDKLGLEYKTNHIPMIDLRQIFVMDPNGVLFELNYYAE